MIKFEIKRIDHLRLTDEQAIKFLNEGTFEDDDLTEEQWNSLIILIGSYTGEPVKDFKEWLLDGFEAEG